MPYIFLNFVIFILIIIYVDIFIVEFEKGEDPHVLQTVQWENTTVANIMLSPNTEVLVISHGSSLSFYSTITGLLDTTIEDIFLGIFSFYFINSLYIYLYINLYLFNIIVLQDLLHA